MASHQAGVWPSTSSPPSFPLVSSAPVPGRASARRNSKHRSLETDFATGSWKGCGPRPPAAGPLAVCPPRPPTCDPTQVVRQGPSTHRAGSQTTWVASVMGQTCSPPRARSPRPFLQKNFRGPSCHSATSKLTFCPKSARPGENHRFIRLERKWCRSSTQRPSSPGAGGPPPAPPQRRTCLWRLVTPQLPS